MRHESEANQITVINWNQSDNWGPDGFLLLNA